MRLVAKKIRLRNECMCRHLIQCRLDTKPKENRRRIDGTTKHGELKKCSRKTNDSECIRNQFRIFFLFGVDQPHSFLHGVLCAQCVSMTNNIYKCVSCMHLCCLYPSLGCICIVFNCIVYQYEYSILKILLFLHYTEVFISNGAISRIKLSFCIDQFQHLVGASLST